MVKERMEKLTKTGIKVLDNNWYIKNKEYIDNLNVMYDRVSNIHRYTESYYFTDHSITHSIRIMDNLEHLFPFLFHDGIPENMLNDVEKFILFSGILLHDIGIELSKEEILKKTVKKYKGEDIEEKIKKDKKLDYIRKHHHELSKFWIKENILQVSELNLPLVYQGDKILAKYVANVAESHGKDFEKELEYTETFAYGNNVIRMGLLCTLLSLGDALDCDQRRINYETLKLSEISLESRLHWMKHYYVDGIILTSNLIRIFYSFPKCEDENIKNLYEKYFVHKTKYWIEKCFTERKNYLFPVGAICRVVDYIKCEDDKDFLSDEELSKIKDYYVDMLLKNSGSIDYLQYSHILIVSDSKDKILLDKDGKILNICIPAEDIEKKKIKTFIKDILNTDDESIYIGGEVKERAIHYYYLVMLSSDLKELPREMKWETLENNLKAQLKLPEINNYEIKRAIQSYINYNAAEVRKG